MSPHRRLRHHHHTLFALSQDLYFLLSGEVEILSRYDDDLPIAWLTPTMEIARDHDVDGSFSTAKHGRHSSDFSGCFGQALLLGRRHSNSHRAGTDGTVEVLAIRREDLEQVRDCAAERVGPNLDEPT